MASRGGFRSRPLTKTIFVKIGDGPETSPPDLVYSIKNALLKGNTCIMKCNASDDRLRESRVELTQPL